ncbi:hypothetical protein [Endozoicomonas sp. 4G]|uniref:hypothetical protein n=1 Tax=Endozoicomonas sp. 4G TaxID=2872754 RepID=UPI00207899FD|nr:hypothetical protein [Endozoicomonas sp. 4G]
MVLSADPAQDLSELITHIPENTVLLFSSDTHPGVMPSPSATSITGKIPVEYFTDHEIILKNGQDMIGAADDGFEIVIRDRPEFKHRHLIRVGTAKNFQYGETKGSHIKHITFRPTGNDKRDPLDAIVFAECSNRKLIIENNRFHSPFRAATALDCRQSLDASAADWLQGPALRFANNRIIGKESNPVIAKRSTHVIPNQGLWINLPAITSQSGQLSVIGNTFEGYMAKAGEFRLASGTHIKVFKNKIDIANASSSDGGLVLEGPAKPVTSPAFFLAGNQIRATQTAITVRGQLGLTLACNHLQAVIPWWQPQKQFSLQVPLKTPGEVTNVCDDIVSSTVASSTPNTLGSSRLTNTWTAIKNSVATACSGLSHLEGQLLFDTEVCQPVTPSTSAAGTTAVTMGLGVMATLAMLLNL